MNDWDSVKREVIEMLNERRQKQTGWPPEDPVSEDETPTLRDQFAMAALTGLLASGRNTTVLPKEAYPIADAMIKARESDDV